MIRQSAIRRVEIFRERNNLGPNYIVGDDDEEEDSAQPQYHQLLYNPLTQFVVQTMAASSAEMSAGHMNNMNHGLFDPEQLAEQLFTQLFLGGGTTPFENSFENSFFDVEPKDVRQPDQLVCPTCMAVHLPVEQITEVAQIGRAGVEGEELRGEGENEWNEYVPQILGGRVWSLGNNTTHHNDDDLSSMPPLEDANPHGESGSTASMPHPLIDIDNEKSNTTTSATPQPVDVVSIATTTDDLLPINDGEKINSTETPQSIDVQEDDEASETSSVSMSPLQQRDVLPPSPTDERNGRAVDSSAEPYPLLRHLMQQTNAQTQRDEQDETPNNEDDQQQSNNPVTRLRDYGAIRVFASSTCPVCLEEHNPVVALKCGHCLCEHDFENYGGYLA